jgi:hypothetical protein
MVANIRIVPQGSKEPEYHSREEDAYLTKTQKRQIYDRRESRPPMEATRIKNALNKPNFDTAGYPRFSSLITTAQKLKPKKRPFSWLLTSIEELYDARYAHDTADLKNDGPEDGPSDRLSDIFPVFVVDFFSKRYGLRSLVDQGCWDLLFNMHAQRKQYLEVEVFARFLEEFYDQDDLLFFLYVRSVVQKMLDRPFKNRWKERKPPTLVLDKKQCIAVSRTVFGSDQDPMFKEFMAMIENELVGDPRSGQRIEVTHFLHLAVVGYHETRPDDSGGDGGGDVDEQGGGGGGAGGMFSQDEQDALFREAEANFEAAQQTGEGGENYLEDKLAEQIRYALEQRGDEGAADDDYINHVTQEMLQNLGADPQDEALQYAQEQHAGNGDTGQVDSYLDQVTDDRQAIERMEQDLAGGGDDQRLDIMLRLNEAVNQHAQQFVEDMLVQCSNLPEEVVEEIRAETSTQLGAKTELIVSQMARPVGAPAEEAYETLVSSQNARALEEAFNGMVQQGPAVDEQEVFEMGMAIVQLPEIRQEIEPLVALLTSYASARLEDGSGSA